jgi:hypothetical protein
MKLIDIDSQNEKNRFAEAATNYFNENSTATTYAKNDPEPGKFLALRWNAMAVLILKIHPEDEVSIYPVYQFIQSDLPKLQPTSN